MVALHGPRSVAELLPAAFDTLTVEHVREILRTVGDPRETLYFERKRAVTPETLAKACAAFANTYGGLLIVGIDDKTDKLVGVEQIAEPQVWVKDVLRAQLLPMPPFRARWLPLDTPDKGLLAVLVEESSTTPHLLTRRGAIYVRNPGSSDPAPIRDQALLLELVRRGREAREAAVSRGARTLEQVWNSWPLFTLSLAPTGVSSDVVRDLYKMPDQARRLLQATLELYDLQDEPESRATFSGPQWSLHSVSASRSIRRSFGEDPEAFLDGLVITSDCAVQIQRCLVPPERMKRPEPRGPRPLHLDEGPLGIVRWFSGAVNHGRELILTLGAHGDLHITADVQGTGRHFFYRPTQAGEFKRSFRNSYWIDPVGESDDPFLAQLTQDLLREINVAAE